MIHYKPIKLTFSERLFAVAVLSLVLNFSFPQLTHAAAPRAEKKSETVALPTLVLPILGALEETMKEPTQPLVVDGEPKKEESLTKPKKARRILWVLVTAYSSTPDQTDSSPYITAKNTFVRDGVVASNFLSFDTRIRIPQYFGNREFFVEDRMNERFSTRIDIWMPTRGEAKQWGARWVKVEIL